MNTALELAGVALAALLSENMVLVSCTGIGTHRPSFQDPKQALRTGFCLTLVMVLGGSCAWLLDYLVLGRFALQHFRLLAFALLIPGLVAGLRRFFRDLGMPTTLAEIGAKAEDIPAMVAHRAEKPKGFPFGGFVSIGPKEMEEILHLAQ